MPAKTPPKKSKSVLKRDRQTLKKTSKNRSVKNMFRTLSKKVELEVANKNLEGAKTALKIVVSVISRAATKGIIHKNTASRKVSKLTRIVNSLLRSGAV